MDTWAERMAKLSALRDLVIRHLETASDRHALYYDASRSERVYERGDEVLRQAHVLSSGADYRAAKLAPRYEGPFIISKVHSPIVYEIKTATGQQAGKIYVNDLKPY